MSDQKSLVVSVKGKFLEGQRIRYLEGENSAFMRTKVFYTWTQRYIVLNNTSPVCLNLLYLIIVCRHVCMCIPLPQGFTKEHRKRVLKTAGLFYTAGILTWM